MSSQQTDKAIRDVMTFINDTNTSMHDRFVQRGKSGDNALKISVNGHELQLKVPDSFVLVLHFALRARINKMVERSLDSRHRLQRKKSA